MRVLRNSHIVITSEATDQTWVQVSNKFAHERHWEHTKFDRTPTIVYHFADGEWFAGNVDRCNPQIEANADRITAFASTWWDQTDRDGSTIRDRYQAELDTAVRATIRRLETVYNEQFKADFEAYFATLNTVEEPSADDE